MESPTEHPPKDTPKVITAILGGVLFFSSATGQTNASENAHEPLTPTTVAVPANSTATVQYRVTNQSSRTHTLVMQAIRGITQTTGGFNLCDSAFVLPGKSSCLLTLEITGSQLTNPIIDGPVVCQQGSTVQCYRPASANLLRITQDPPITTAVITVSGSPLTLTANGATGTLSVHNTSTIVSATNVASDFSGTALNGNVSETGNTCANIPPGGNCTLTYTPGNTAVAQTNFPIQGTNTNAVTAAIAIQEVPVLGSINPSSGTASGGTGFTLTGTGLTDATSVTFGGVAATSVNPVSSTTVTGVTPAHAVGAVDVIITTPSGSATLTSGYTYLATGLGQLSGGGKIACLNTGNNLIAAMADNSSSIIWGGFAVQIGAFSNTDGALNTSTIVAALGNNGGTPYAAKLCSDYEVDSQGHTPCQAGNTCYNDWFLPAGNNASGTGQLNCLYTNKASIGGLTGGFYWSSTEFNSAPWFGAWGQYFTVGTEQAVTKNGTSWVRCVRSFTP